MINRLTVLPLILLAPMVGAQDADGGVSKPLAKAQARAQVHNKRVLVIGCAEGVDLQKSLKSDRKLSRKLLYEFETVQLAGDQHGKQWRSADGAAALTVLDASGKQLAQFAASAFVGADEMRSDDLLKKLEPLFCAPVDAEKKLAAALVEAKKSGRNVFIRFDAPW